jgi:TRAP transporter 4TM/12TM fusion protein
MTGGLCKKDRPKLLKVYDLFLILLTLAIASYMVTCYEEIALKAGIPDLIDKIFLPILGFLIIEAAVRVLGLPMPCVTVAFVLYVLFGSHLPGIFAYTGISYTRLTDHFFISSNGILGLPTGVSAVYVAIFIYFATFLLKSGAADFFKDLSIALAGSKTGGPAKVAVVASAFAGTMMGSAVANVATTGSFTIPMMKKVGYAPHFAAGVEAVASTGGQIMPPVMASVIFLISEYTGIPFSKLMINAFVPAFLYFLCIFWEVHFEALKTNLPSIPKEELPRLRDVFAKGPWYLLIPLPVLVVLLLIGYTPFLSAFWATVAILVCSWVRPKTRMGLRKIIEAIVEGSIGCIAIGLACGAASIIVGSVEITGLGLRFSGLIIALAGGNDLFLLFLAMLASLVLGMGMTTVPAYIIVAILTVPALTKLGINPLAAHFFCFYYSIINAITPPVALASFTAAGMAKANELKTSLVAMKLGIVGLIVPYLFVYNTSYFLIGPVQKIIPTLIFAFTGVYALAAFIQGYMFTKVLTLGRVILLAVSAALLWPNTFYLNLIGLAMFAVYYISQRASLKRSLQAQIAPPNP